MEKNVKNSHYLAEAITQSASTQTYLTIRFLVKRDLAAHAYRAYAYYRWVDDILDAREGSTTDKLAFLDRQKTLLDACYSGGTTKDLCAEEQMLYDLVCHDSESNSGLQLYLRNMMAVMDFDVRRRGKIVTQAELDEYSRHLATAVTEAIYYFIGYDNPLPCPETRYLAVTAAHIVHMLRDAYEDTKAGYYNVSGEYLKQHGISVQDLQSQSYRQWVCKQAQLARRYFRESRESHAQIKSLRCRLASHAYIARFEWMLRTIERENYCLRSDYPDRKGLSAALWMGWSILGSMLHFPERKSGFHPH